MKESSHFRFLRARRLHICLQLEDVKLPNSVYLLINSAGNVLIIQGELLIAEAYLVLPSRFFLQKIFLIHADILRHQLFNISAKNS